MSHAHRENCQIGAPMRVPCAWCGRTAAYDPRGRTGRRCKSCRHDAFMPKEGCLCARCVGMRAQPQPSEEARGG